MRSIEKLYLTTQHERDEETGLDYRGARYYDADIERFLSLDPHASDYSSWSAYNYVFGNPVHYIDMDGKDGVPFTLAFSRGLNDAFMASTVQFGFGRELAADAYPDDLEAQRAFLIGQLVADVAVMTAGGATMNTGAGILGTALTIEIGSFGTATVGSLGMSIAGGITIAVGTNMVIQAGVGAESSILQLSAVNRKIDAQKNAGSGGGTSTK